MVIINGKPVDAAGNTITEYLEQANYKREHVVVECNLEIIPKADYDTVVFKDNDEVEVVSFMGGG